MMEYAARERRGAPLAERLLLAVAACCLLVFHLPCVFRLATGLLCPFCGGTRAIQALLNGQVVRSLHCNALAVPTCALCLALCLRPALVNCRRLRYGLLVAYGMFTLLRNLPFAPCACLAP